MVGRRHINFKFIIKKSINGRIFALCQILLVSLVSQINFHHAEIHEKEKFFIKENIRMKKLLTCIVSVLFAFCFCMTGCSTDDETTKQRVPLSIKRNIIEGTYGSSSSEGTYYGVGRTINAVTDEYITVSAGYAKIFDTDKLLDMNWNRSYAGQMRAKSSLGSSMKDLYAHLGVEFNLAIGGEASFLNIFSAGLQSDFEFAGNIAYSETANEIFYTFSQVYAATLIEIDEYYDLDKFREILSEEVLHDAASLQEGGMTASQFIYKYGTHAVLAGYYGGRVDCSYYLRNVGTQWDADAAANYENSVSMAMSKLFNANVDSSFSVKGELSLDESTLQERFSSSSVGGKNFKAASITDFIENYGEWVSSVNKIEEHSNIVGLPNRSLVAIWDLFPHEYAQARQTLSSYFAEYAQATSSEFLSKYERHYSQDDGLIPGIHYISTKSLSCKLDNGYNYEQPSPKADDPHYSHEFELGKFVLKDCAEDLDQNDTYQLCDNIATNLTFRLEYDADTLLCRTI